MTTHLDSPAGSTDFTFRHQDGSFSGSPTTAQIFSGVRAICIDSSIRIEGAWSHESCGRESQAP
jgi:hypothetical protein